MELEELQKQALQVYQHVLEMIYNNPVHVAIETVMFLFIAYIVLAKRAYDPAKR
jgi:hypothetical protein